MVGGLCFFLLPLLITIIIIFTIINHYLPLFLNLGLTPNGTFGWPLLGETLTFLKPHPSNSIGYFLQTHISRYGKVFKSHLFCSPTIVSCDEDLNYFILQNEDKLFQCSYPKPIHGILGKSSMLVVVGDTHKRLRNMALTLVGNTKSKPEYLNDIERTAIQILGSWKGKQQVFFCEEARKFTFNVIVKQILGLTPEDPQTTYILEHFLTFMKGLISFPMYIPGTPYAKAVQARIRISSTVKAMVEERKKSNNTSNGGENNKKMGDFLEMLLSVNSLSEDEKVSFVLDSLLGGYETTSLLMAMAVHFLGQSPTALEQLKLEHESIRLLKEKDEYLNWEDYKKMEFTQNVINETLRCGNIVKFVHRKALKDIKFKDYVIPAGWKVLPVFSAVHLDSSLHETNCLQFHPWRWEKIPLQVINKLEQIERCFWWGHTQNEKKIHFVNWQIICSSKQHGGLGIRALAEVNDSLIAKLTWRYLTNPDATWVKILNSKYIKTGDFWSVSNSSPASPVWKAILNLRDTFSSNILWQIGDGKHVNICSDPWLIDMPNRRPSLINNLPPDITKVYHLRNIDNTDWNMNLLLQHFDQSSIEAITSINLNPSHNEDTLIWTPIDSGRFTTKSFYHLIRERPVLNDRIKEFPWNKLWKRKNMNPKIQNFIWKVLHNGIATLNNLGKFNTTISTACLMCNTGEEETIDHLFGDCQMFKQLIDTTNDIRLKNLTMDPIKNLSELLNRNETIDDEWKIYTYLLWWWWKTRNEKVFRSKEPDLQRCWWSIKQEVSLSNPSLSNPISSSVMQVIDWLPPPSTKIKINVDGAFEPPLAAAGAIARNENGVILGTKSTRFQAVSPLHSEMIGFRLGYELSIELGLGLYILEGDSKSMVDMLSEGDCVLPWRLSRELGMLRNDIRSSNVELQFCPRICNSEAHQLAKSALHPST